ncbi:MAG TPA: tetratricopeptide repeat protein [Myxococcales bacterium]|jgi:tetratricopeptide (TPR) repeat protein
MTRAAGLALALGVAAWLGGADALAAGAAKAKRSAPSSSTSSPAPAGEAERVAGQKAFDAGNYQDALAPLERAWELGAKPAVLYTLGQCHRQVGNWEKAAFYFGRYLALAPRPIADEEAARTLLSEMQLKADVGKQQQPKIEVAQPTVPPEAVVPPSALPAKPEPVPAAGTAEVGSGAVHTKWWFWTAIGAVVVGGAVTGAVLATQPHGKAPTTLGELQW